MHLCCLLAAALLAADDAPPAEKQRLQSLYLQEAARWRMVVDEDRKREAKLEPTPVYVWTNPTRSGGQHGAVFVWTDGGRAAVVGSIFSQSEAERRRLCNEFHSLASGPLLPERSEGAEQWRPKTPVPLETLPDAAAPEATAARRLPQMRALAREFSAHSIDNSSERWELRLLTQPLYRYRQPQGQTVDGALFAFVTSAGTDPEAMLALEACREGGRLEWRYRLLRFSDSNLYVERGGREIWTSVRDEQNELFHNADHTYRLILDKFVDESPDLNSPTR